MGVAAVRWAVCLSLCGFYAGVARRRRDLPAAPPVVVMNGDLALDGDRAAYTLGLRPGSPLRQVRRICPGAVLVDYEEKEYLAAAEAFWGACLGHTPLVEPGAGGGDWPALHRVCLGLPTPSEQPPRAEVAALQQTLVAAFGFAAPAGIATNKLVAVAAARLQLGALLGLEKARRSVAEPGGAFPVVVTPGQETSFLARLSLPYLWPATAVERRRLADLGLGRIGEVAAVPEAELVRQFGPRGRALHRWSRGVDPEPVRAAWPPRTVASRISFADPRSNLTVLAAALARLAKELAAGLRQRDEACQQAALAVELAGGERRSAERLFSHPQSTPYYMEQTLLALLRQLLPPPAAEAPPPAVVALEASLGHLGPVPRRQATLLADLVALPPSTPDPEQAARLELTVAALRERYPAHVIRLGVPGVPSRREAMLTLYDPYRWASGEEGAGPWPGSSASR